MKYWQVLSWLYNLIQPIAQISHEHKIPKKFIKPRARENEGDPFWNWFDDNLWVVWVAIGVIVVLGLAILIFERRTQDMSNKTRNIILLILAAIVLTLLVVFS